MAKDLYVECLSLFLTLLLRSEQIDLLRANAEAKDNEEDKLDSILSSNIHIYLSAIGCIQVSYVLKTLRLLTRVGLIYLVYYPEFRRTLTTVYARNYNMPSIVLFSGAFA